MEGFKSFAGVAIPKSNFSQVLKDIKSLKIQGASQVRKAAVSAVRQVIKSSPSKSAEQLRNEVKSVAIQLVNARPTEPELRTAIRIILQKLHAQVSDVEQLRSLLLQTIDNYESDRKKALQLIADYGANKIPAGSIVFTHCHSHTVEDILKLAHRQGKLRQVICTETRPRNQGHITATNLSKAGIPVTFIVDSAAAVFMRKAQIFLTGADAILEDGSVVNKIGTALISRIANEFQVPHYVAASTHKFDPVTFFGQEETIEERSPAEVWAKKPGKVKIANPAFDVTDANLIKGIITEKGIFTPKNLAMLMYQELDLANRKDEFLSLTKLTLRNNSFARPREALLHKVGK